MQYNSFQKKFIVYICEYKTDIQGYLLKNILQDFLFKNNEYGLKVKKNSISILAKNNEVKSGTSELNRYTYEVYSLIYLLYELEKKDLIYFSDTIITNEFQCSLTAFKNDYNINININKDKSDFFLNALNSQIFISSEMRPLILFKRFFFDKDKFLFGIGILVSIATILTSFFDVLTFFFTKNTTT